MERNQPYKSVVSRDFEIRKQIVYEFNHENHYRFIKFNVFHGFMSSTWMNLTSDLTDLVWPKPDPAKVLDSFDLLKFSQDFD